MTTDFTPTEPQDSSHLDDDEDALEAELEAGLDTGLDTGLPGASRVAGIPGAGPSLHTITAPQSASGTRLDKYLADWLEPAGLTRSRLQALIAEGQVQVNGATALTNHKLSSSTKLKGGELLTVVVPAPRPSELVPQNIPLEVLYEDGWLLVLNKPPGMVVHPAKGAEEGTLVHALLFRVDDLSGIGGEERPGIVHRLDKDTSGVLVVAKCDAAHRHLSEQFKIHSITRRYRALVRGNPPESGTWRSNLGRSPHNRLKMASLKYGGRSSITHYKVLERFPGASLMEFTLETGRTHQIRVHTSEAGFPILCDGVYGGHWQRGLPVDPALEAALQAANRQLLHARQLTFEHPEDGRIMAYMTEVPADFQRVLDALRRLTPSEYVPVLASAEGNEGPDAPGEAAGGLRAPAWDPLSND